MCLWHRELQGVIHSVDRMNILPSLMASNIAKKKYNVPMSQGAWYQLPYIEPHPELSGCITTLIVRNTP